MIVYIVTNKSRSDEVMFGKYTDNIKVFIDPKQAIRQYSEWTKNVSGFGMNELGLCLQPGSKNVRMSGDDGAELLTLETSDSVLSGGE